MRTTKEITAQSRARILKTASRMLRERGLEGTSIADVMHEAGMTHGGFYKHFSSKDELADLAARAAFDEVARRFDERNREQGIDAARKTYLEEYLSIAHIEHPEAGCPVSAFGADAGRHSKALASAFADGAEMLIARIASGDSGRRPDAIRKLTMLVGAVVVARAVGKGSLRDEILGACDVG